MFIGDGLTGIGTGSLQQFQIPNAADVLYLGVHDVGNNDNVGSLQVAISLVPEPTDIMPKMNYQGYLTDTGGVPITGDLSILFSIYNVENDGIPLWSETQTVTVANGTFSVNLGDITPINLPFDVQYYLGVQVGTDPEMTPRVAFNQCAVCLSGQRV